MTAIDERGLVDAELAIRSAIKADATGLAPAVIGHYLTGFEEAARAAITAYLQALRPGSEGWVLVPKEPTMKMLESGMAAMRVALSDGLPRDQRQAAGYRAMLAAAGGRE